MKKLITENKGRNGANYVLNKKSCEEWSIR